MYVLYDSDGIIQSVAVAPKVIEGYTSPVEGLTELFLDDTQYSDVAQEPSMYKIVANAPVKQTQPYIPPAPQPSIEERLAAVEAALAALMGV